ncbi:MAG: hypothetical protein A3F69_00705 [Acidobacteria bacterium RIFCSPLOWO2_12_FULL_66_10]|nr:MAG: hypothetical protein A3F69_00705 [Acidobacteria bacterium RIFCSPLOWO2_12_FULL_66_10]
MPEREQNYKNHVRFLPVFHFFVIPVLLVNVIIVGRHAVQMPDLSTGFAFIVATALLMLGFLSRTQPLVAQDRVIRVEMQRRLRHVLPADLQARAAALTPKQLVALRFAGDKELPALVRDVLDGRLQSQKSIKLAIKHWQADWFRV